MERSRLHFVTVAVVCLTSIVSGWVGAIIVVNTTGAVVPDDLIRSQQEGGQHQSLSKLRLPRSVVQVVRWLHQSVSAPKRCCRPEVLALPGQTKPPQDNISQCGRRMVLLPSSVVQSTRSRSSASEVQPLGLGGPVEADRFYSQELKSRCSWGRKFILNVSALTTSPASYRDPREQVTGTVGDHRKYISGRAWFTQR